MTLEEMATMLEEHIASDSAVVLVSSTGKQPIPRVRGELLCVNNSGESVYRYTPAQCKRILKRVRITQGHEAVAPPIKDFHGPR